MTDWQSIENGDEQSPSAVNVEPQDDVAAYGGARGGVSVRLGLPLLFTTQGCKPFPGKGEEIPQTLSLSQPGSKPGGTGEGATGG